MNNIIYHSILLVLHISTKNYDINIMILLLQPLKLNSLLYKLNYRWFNLKIIGLYSWPIYARCKPINWRYKIVP